MQVFVQLSSVGADAGPFMIYSNVDGYVTAYAVQVSAATLTTGVMLTLPEYTTSVKVRSNGKCTNSIIVNI
jgi:hypothetical protein